jgi:hypothetical protein
LGVVQVIGKLLTIVNITFPHRRAIVPVHIFSGVFHLEEVMCRNLLNFSVKSRLLLVNGRRNKRLD